MLRSNAKAAELPAGASPVLGDIEQPSCLTDVFARIDNLFFLTPVSQTETEQGLAVVDAAKKTGIKRIVYMSVALPKGSEHIPHFGSKIPIEQAILKSTIPFTILRPNNFMQNDFWYKDAILKYSVYPQPIGNKGMNRIDVRDIADAAVNALTSQAHEGKTYTLHGPDVHTGIGTAKIYSRYLERPINYGGDDLDVWSKQALTMLPEWMVHDFRIMYEYFQQNGFTATYQELAEQEKVIGHLPRTFETFLEEITPSWKSSVTV